MDAVDLFAGPGGWDVGARALGLDPLGVEWDDGACATREVAGLRTVQADVSELDPADFGPCDLLIASPPCQAWSLAGNGGGRRDVELCFEAVRDLAEGCDTRAEIRARCEDERSVLVVEPLRWALALRPRLLAFEQVPPVLPFWRALADVLRREGYSVWAYERPATTVAGDPRVHPPGHKINADDIAAGRGGHDRAGSNAIRVTVQEAAALQTFPPGHPWQGSRTKQFEQIGNAVPPLLAERILAALIET